jgi:glycosyltransferase involved in cell wall biosynthesis
MPTLVVLPSYNERLNIVELTDAILDVDPANDVCIVDDSSPDGTADCVRDAAATRPHTSRRRCRRAWRCWTGSRYPDGTIIGSPASRRLLSRLANGLARLLRAGHRIGSFPICFRNRERGVSNASLGEIWSSLHGIFSIAVAHRLGRR